MLGAIIGDIVGSRFEWNNHKSIDFDLFSPMCHFTDDSAMTFAVAKAVLESRDDWDSLGTNAVKQMQQIGKRYSNCGYGHRFYLWLHSSDPKPYQSYGNGAAMRISPVAYAAETIEQCIRLSDAVTCVSHDHPEGLKGAQAAAVSTWMALHDISKDNIRKTIEEKYYDLDFTIDGIRSSYSFDVSCQGSVPQAIRAFMESYDFESAIRLAVSIGGDSDTIAAIAGGIAGAYYGVPDEIRNKAMEYLPTDLIDILTEFEAAFC